MILLDSDHLSILQHFGSDRRARIVARMALATDEVFGTTIVNVEEQMKGWLATLAKERQALRQVSPYARLAGLFKFFQSFILAPFDEPAAELFNTFNRIRIGTADRKIAAVARAQNALLLTANRRGYEQIPGLQFANWLD